MQQPGPHPDKSTGALIPRFLTPHLENNARAEVSLRNDSSSPGETGGDTMLVINFKPDGVRGLDNRPLSVRKLMCP